MDKYNPLQLVQDATAFVESRFGQHYLKALRQAKERHLKTAMDIHLDDSTRAHAATMAATVQAELDYFVTVRTIKETPSLMDKLRKSLERKEEPIV